MATEESFPRRIRLEEEEIVNEPRYRPQMGFARRIDEKRNEEDEGDEEERRQVVSPEWRELIIQLTEERHTILTDAKLKASEKSKLLESNRKTLVVIMGGTVRSTENVIYGILIFGSVVLIILALLTAYAGLSSDVTLAFVGTVLGGTIATITQKLGKL
jgi:hypothetical protein